MWTGASRNVRLPLPGSRGKSGGNSAVETATDRNARYWIDVRATPCADGEGDLPDDAHPKSRAPRSLAPGAARVPGLPGRPADRPADRRVGPAGDRVGTGELARAGRPQTR